MTPEGSTPDYGLEKVTEGALPIPVKTPAQKAGAVVVVVASGTGTALAAVARGSWAVVAWSAPLLWHGLMRLGRVLLWIFVWPFGLWRSMRHGNKKDAKKMQAFMAQQNEQLRQQIALQQWQAQQNPAPPHP